MIRVMTPRELLRKLWADHVALTRMFVVERTARPRPLPGVAQTLARLFRNQDEIGAALAVFFGQRAGNEVAKLLRQHIALAGQVVAEALGGGASTETVTKWKANASDIASALCRLNPRWDCTAIDRMLQHHLDLLTQEVVAQIRGDYAASLQAYDASIDEILSMADALADGLAGPPPRRYGFRPLPWGLR